MAMSLLLAVAGCGGDSVTNSGNDNGNTNGNTNGTTNGDTNGTTPSVTVGDDFFNPTSIQVSPGAMVTWTWSSNRVHNVTFENNTIIDSGDRGGGTYETAMPTTDGTYGYQCKIHPITMNGSVTVSNSGSGEGISYNLR